MMSRGISPFSKSNLRSPAPISMSVPAEVETSASGSAWVSDLELCDGALELAGALSSGSGCESGLPKRTSTTSPSTTIGSSSSGSPSSVMSAKCRVRPSRTASVRFDHSDVTVSVPSTSSLVAGPHLCTIALMQAGPHPHLPCAPSFRLCMKTGSPATSTRWGFRLSTVGCCRHRTSVGGDYAPMGGCHSHSLASPHFVRSVLSDHVGSMKSSSSRLDGSRSCRPKNSLTGRKSSTSHASIQLRKVNQLIDFGLRRRSFQTARFFEFHFEQGSMSLNNGILPRRFPNQLPRVGSPWVGTGVENQHRTLYPGP